VAIVYGTNKIAVDRKQGYPKGLPKDSLQKILSEAPKLLRHYAQKNKSKKFGYNWCFRASGIRNMIPVSLLACSSATGTENLIEGAHIKKSCFL